MAGVRRISGLPSIGHLSTEQATTLAQDSSSVDLAGVEGRTIAMSLENLLDWAQV